MALIGGTFGDGVATGATPVSLATILGTTRQEYRQIDIRCAAASVGVILVGDATVSGTTAWVELSPGESWGLNPQAYTAPAGGDFKITPDDIFIVGTNVADQAYVAALQ